MLSVAVIALVLYQRERNRVSHWPVTEGTIETFELGYTGAGSRYQIPVCWLGYWYFGEGNRYSGYFAIPIADRDEAWVLGERLKGTKIEVHVNPNDSNDAQVLPQEPIGYSVIPKMKASQSVGTKDVLYEIALGFCFSLC